MTGATPAERQAAIERFAAERDRFNQVGVEVCAILRDLLKTAGLDLQPTHRVKTVASFRSKLALKTHYTDPWTQVTDKVGVRLLVQRQTDVDHVARLIDEDGRLEIWGRTDKRAELDETELGYSGLHLDVWAPPGAGSNDPVTCEVQLRTIAQDAWSVVSHKLIYKPESTLEPADRRAIMRLVALVEVFDEEVERVMDKQGAATTPVVAGPASDLATVVAGQYSTFETNEGHVDLTRRVLAAVEEALEGDGVTDYRAELVDFVSANRTSLVQLYDDYGPRSAMATSPDYVLWSQPESIAIIECLDRRPARLRAAWEDRGLPNAWLEPIAAHTDAPPG